MKKIEESLDNIDRHLKDVTTELRDLIIELRVSAKFYAKYLEEKKNEQSNQGRG